MATLVVTIFFLVLGVGMVSFVAWLVHADELERRKVRKKKNSKIITY